jgi:hypothetical protein
MGAVTHLQVPQVSVAGAARLSRLELLVALRDTIAGEIDGGVPPRDLAALSRRLMELAEDIEEIRAVQAEEDDVSLAAVTPDTPWTV